MASCDGSETLIYPPEILESILCQCEELKHLLNEKRDRDVANDVILLDMQAALANLKLQLNELTEEVLKVTDDSVADMKLQGTDLQPEEADEDSTVLQIASDGSPIGKTDKAETEVFEAGEVESVVVEVDSSPHVKMTRLLGGGLQIEQGPITASSPRGDSPPELKRSVPIGDYLRCYRGGRFTRPPAKPNPPKLVPPDEAEDAGANMIPIEGKSDGFSGIVRVAILPDFDLARESVLDRFSSYSPNSGIDVFTKFYCWVLEFEKRGWDGKSSSTNVLGVRRLIHGGMWCSRVSFDIVMKNSVIDMYVKGDFSDFALRVFEMIEVKPLILRLSVYKGGIARVKVDLNAMISVYAQWGRGQDGLRFFGRMMQIATAAALRTLVFRNEENKMQNEMDWVQYISQQMDFLVENYQQDLEVKKNMWRQESYECGKADDSLQRMSNGVDSSVSGYASSEDQDGELCSIQARIVKNDIYYIIGESKEDPYLLRLPISIINSGYRREGYIKSMADLIDKGVKSLLPVPASFVSEHKGTLEEIYMGYRVLVLALESVIGNWGRVPALNCTSSFISDLVDAVIDALPSATTIKTAPMNSNPEENERMQNLRFVGFTTLLLGLEAARGVITLGIQVYETGIRELSIALWHVQKSPMMLIIFQHLEYMISVACDFEMPLLDLKKKIVDVRKVADKIGLDVSNQILSLEIKYQQALRDLCVHSKHTQSVDITRHPNWPFFLIISAILLRILSNLMETKWVMMLLLLPVTIEGQRYMFMVQQKGRNTEANIMHKLGMLTAYGYRKPLRLICDADHHTSEKLGQGKAITHNLRTMFDSRVLVESIMGEGGASVIGCAISYVVRPEACTVILWKSAKASPKATVKLKIAAEELYKLQVADGIIWVPFGGFQEGIPIDPQIKTNMKKKRPIFARTTEVGNLKKKIEEAKDSSTKKPNLIINGMIVKRQLEVETLDFQEKHVQLREKFTGAKLALGVKPLSLSIEVVDVKGKSLDEQAVFFLLGFSLSLIDHVFQVCCYVKFNISSSPRAQEVTDLEDKVNLKGE